MKKVIINENQKGFLFSNGKYVKTVDAGKYYLTSGKELEVVDINLSVKSNYAPIDTLLNDDNFKSKVVVCEVEDEQIVLHYINGRYAGFLTVHGKYVFWKENNIHEFKVFNTSNPEVDEAFPKFIFEKLLPTMYYKFEVNEYQKARLFFNNKLNRILDSGVYYFWKNSVKVNVDYIDTRLTKLDIIGQEIMTLDKVALRINFVCNYKIADYVKVLTEIDDYVEQMHVLAQLALRDFVGKYRLDEILENKDELSKYVFEKMKAKEQDLFVEIRDAGVKDIILPGEIRNIMNTVLIAEKQAQANVITRREEVASTRSLLNTAKLMEENQTLYKLKELEYVEKIFDNVGNITLNGSGDVLNQLLGLVGKK